MGMDVGAGRYEAINTQGDYAQLKDAPQVKWDGKLLNHSGLLTDGGAVVASFDNPKDALSAIKQARAGDGASYVFVATQVDEGELAGKWIVDKYYKSGFGDVDLDEVDAKSLPGGAFVVDQDGKVGRVGGERNEAALNRAALRDYANGSGSSNYDNEQARQASKKLMNGVSEDMGTTRLKSAFDIDDAKGFGVGLRGRK